MYIGNNLQVAYPSYTNIDDISGSFDGVTTSFALTVGGVAPVPAPLSSNQCMISVGGVVQRPDDTGTEGFRLSGGNIVFSSAPNTGEDFFGVILAGADYVNVGVNYPSGTASTPSITFDTDLDTGLFNSGANELGITTAGTSRLVVDSGGNVNIDAGGAYYDASTNRVGIGTTNPLATIDITGTGECARIQSTTAFSNYITHKHNSSGDIAYIGAGGGAALTSGANTDYAIRANQGALLFGTNGNNERARIDTSGRLLVGTSTAQGATKLQVQDGEVFLRRALANASINAAGIDLGFIDFGNQDGGVGAQILAESDAAWGTGDYPGRLVFSTTADGASSPTERMRISQDGGTLWRSNGATSTHDLGNLNTSIAGDAVTFSAYRNTVNDTFKFLSCVRQGFAVALEIRDDGDVYNVNGTYGSLSDAKLKENIVDANSQWEDIKQLRVRNYNFKPETNNSTHKQIGVIAQEIENVSPGLVNTVSDRDAEGNDLGTVTKSVNYSVLYMKAVKALQEAMERIEQLEAQMAEVKAQLS